MLLYNEKHQQLDVEKLKTILLSSVKADDVPKNDQETEQILDDYYRRASQVEIEEYNLPSVLFENKADNFLVSGMGKTILDKIRKFICSFLNGNSTTQDIIDAVLKALSSIIPGGIIIEALVQKIVSYIISIGIGKFCPVSS